ncbi:hypothetical protein GCM10009575_025570 [Streptomyces rhizosphaericus]|uniref:Uncharacterized protein n=1 Tax=Streptomyces rhizosphaericus TaxID=114699 RepID=A0ABN1PDE7_9ACTN
MRLATEGLIELRRRDCGCSHGTNGPWEPRPPDLSSRRPTITDQAHTRAIAKPPPGQPPCRNEATLQTSPQVGSSAKD